MMYSRKLIVLLLSPLFFTSCNSQENKSEDKTIIKRDENMKVEFNFYPSSGGSAIYTIDYYNDSLYIKNLEPTGNELTDFKKYLSENEIERVKQMVSKLKKRDVIETNIILDAWRVELIIDGIIYYNESDVKLETLPTDIKSLLNLLIEESTVKIDLYGFS